VKELAVALFVLAIVCGGAPSLALLIGGLGALLLVIAWWP